MAQLKITLTKSPIGRIPAQRKTVKALGLGKVGSSVVKEDTVAMRGMIASVAHLVALEGEAVTKEKTISKKETKPTAVKSEKPTTASKVAEIKDYLTAKGIKYSSTAKKADLLELVK